MFDKFYPGMDSAPDAISSAVFGGLFAFGIFVMTILFLAVYVYTAYSWMTIAKKQKYKKAWLAWIPIANVAMILQLGGFHWAWVFLILGAPLMVIFIGFIPIIALFVLTIIATWRIFEKRKYPGWFSLSMIVPKLGGILYLIIIGFVAFKDRKKPIKF